MKNTALLLLFFFLGSACNDGKTDYWLRQGEIYLDRNPDSTRIVLQCIENPESLHDTLRARYNFLYVTSQIRASRIDLSDSLLVESAAIFAHERDSEMVANCFMQAGFLNKYRSAYDRADSFFLRGVKFTSDLQKRIILYEYAGFSQLDKGEPQKALSRHLENMRDTAHISAGWKASVLADLGQVYHCLGEIDSSLFYYRKAIEVALPANNTSQVAYLYRRISSIHKERGDLTQALIDLRAGMSYQKKRQHVPLHFLAQGRIFLHAGDTDSARIYLKKAVESPDIYVAASAYSHLASLYEAEGNYSQAISSLQNYDKSKEDIVNEVYMDQVRKEFQDQKIRIENNELKLKKKQQDIYLLSLSLILIIMIGLGYIIYIRERKKKILQRQRLKEEELKGQVSRLEQERELIILRERATALREQLFRRLSASQKIPSLAGKQKGELDDNKSRLTTEEIDELVQIVNDIWSGFAERLRLTYPRLRPKDIGFCCLLKSGISTKDLASIYYITPSAISQKKARMKREKFDNENETISLDDILRDF